MPYVSNGDIGNRLRKWGFEFKDTAELDAHLKKTAVDLDSKYVLVAILDSMQITNDRLDKIANRVTQLASLKRVANKPVELSTGEQPVADARLKCWRLARKPVLERSDLLTGTGKQSGLRISEDQWFELPPGMRKTLQTSGITHFEQLHYKAWTSLRGMGSSTIHRVVEWRDRHEAQVVPPPTEVSTPSE